MKIAALADRPDPKIHDLLFEADVLLTLGDRYPADVPETDLDHLYVLGNHDSPHLTFPEREGRRKLHLTVAALGGVSGDAPGDHPPPCRDPVLGEGRPAGLARSSALTER